MIKATPQKAIKSLILMFSIWFFLNLIFVIQDDSASDDSTINAIYGGIDYDRKLPSLRKSKQNSTSFNKNFKKNKVDSIIKNSKDKDLLKDVFAQVPGPLSEVQLNLPRNPSGTNASYILNFIKKINQAQTVHNLEIFDLRGGDEALVIVIQVHNRVEYLRHLINSLKKSLHIERTLLIFSLDYFSEEMNEVIKSVDFCPYIQIMYPYPMQIFVNEFPGESADDCPRNLKKAEAVKVRCLNAHHPDKYGHYREAKYTQTKHHWFWKVNHVFDHLSALQHHTGLVLFIEEDHYLVEDFIHVLQQMQKLAKTSCQNCAIFTLGTYDKNPSYVTNKDKVSVTDWTSNKHNMGMAFNRDVWKMIKTANEAFCKFDDYNWDWSLQFVSMSAIKGHLKVMLSKSPRIFHIGECGVHHKGKNCDTEKKVKSIEDLLSNNKKYLFPQKLSIYDYPRSSTRLPKPNGGWGDIRDKELCLNFVKTETHR